MKGLSAPLEAVPRDPATVRLRSALTPHVRWGDLWMVEGALAFGRPA